MSYEGYEQKLCKKGHYWCDGVWEVLDSCPTCKEPAVWSNSVDETNGFEQGGIDIGQFLIREAVFETCPHCNHSSEKSPEVCRIPTKEETLKARIYYDLIDGKWQPADPEDY